MSNGIEFVLADKDNLSYVERNLRFDDRREFLAATGRSSQSYFVEACLLAEEKWVGLLDGEPIGAFGRTYSSPWLLGTEKLTGYRVAKAFMNEGREWLEQWAARWGALVHHSYFANSVHHRLLLALGCEFLGVHSYGPFEMKFIQFVFRGNNHV